MVNADIKICSFLIIACIVSLSHSYNSSAISQLNNEQEAKWTPKVSTKATESSKEIFIPVMPEPKLPSNYNKYKWNSITSFSVKDSSFVFLAGGLNGTFSNGNDLHYFIKSSLIRCVFKNDASKSVQFDLCDDVMTEGTGKFVGAGISSYSYDRFEYGIVVHFDPFRNLTATTVGRCSIVLQYENEIYKDIDPIDPCNSDPDNCRIGIRPFFDVEAKRSHSGGTSLMLYIGRPGRRLIDKYSLSLHSYGVKQSEDYSYFHNFKDYGWSVAPFISTSGKAYISSLGGIVAEFPEGLTDDELYISAKERITFFGFQTMMLFETNRKGERPSVKEFALIVSAPFMPIHENENAGVVYIFCIGSQEVQDTLHGLERNEYFGYSLTNIGDINEDDIDDYAVGSPFLNEDSKGLVRIFTSKSCNSLNRRPIQIITNPRVKNFGLALTAAGDFDQNGHQDLVVMSRESDIIPLYLLKKPFIANCQFSFVDYQPKYIKKGDHITLKVNIKLLRGKGSTERFLPNDPTRLVHQVNPDMLSKDVNRFLVQSNFKSKVFSEHLSVEFNLTANSNEDDMDFITPFLVGYRFLMNCTETTCNQFIYWNSCSYEMQLEQFNCQPEPKCSADLSLMAKDNIISKDDQVEYMNSKGSSRVYNVTLSNRGPTMAYGASLTVTTTGLLTLNSIDSVDNNYVSFVSKRISNQKFQLKFSSEIPKGVVYLNNTIFRVQAFFNGLLNETTNFVKDTSIQFNFSSKVYDSDLSNNVKRIPYEITYLPNVTTSVYKAPKSRTDDRPEPPILSSKYIQADTLGPPLKHVYAIENVGQSILKNVLITAWIPVFTDEQDPIVYLFDKIRFNKTDENVLPRISLKEKIVSYCTINSSWINPNEYISKETHSSHGDFRRRRKRSANTGSSNQPQSSDKKISSSTFHLSQHRVTASSFNEINCQSVNPVFGRPECAEVKCTIPTLQLRQPVHLTIKGWVFIKTFFKYSINEPEIHTNVKVTIPDPPPGVKISSKAQMIQNFAMSQTYFFGGIKPVERKVILWWPIILGILLGLLFLLIVIFTLYKLGFFKRNTVPRASANRVNYRDESKSPSEKEKF